MDRSIQFRRLEEAERHVAEGAEHINKQEALVASLDRDGHDTTEANKLLANFRASSPAWEHRNRILKELAE